MRDLRWLELSLLQEPMILVRRHVTIIALDPIRAIVMANKLLLIVPPEVDSLVAILGDHMNGKDPPCISMDLIH